jgi:hypothetical protein
MRSRLHRCLLATLLATSLAAMAAPSPTQPLPEVKSGGVTVEEFKELRREAPSHSLQVVLASKGSGAYLADVDVTLRALPSREVVLEHRAQGPLVLATLPPGRYELSASFADVRPGAPRTLTRTVVVGTRLSQVVLYFDTGDAVSPDSAPEYRFSLR